MGVPACDGAAVVGREVDKVRVRNLRCWKPLDLDRTYNIG
jgi:hypothetical protein